MMMCSILSSQSSIIYQGQVQQGNPFVDIQGYTIDMPLQTVELIQIIASFALKTL